MLTPEEDMEIAALSKQGWSLSAIARHVGRDRKTVRGYLSGEREPGVRAKPGPDPFDIHHKGDAASGQNESAGPAHGQMGFSFMHRPGQPDGKPGYPGPCAAAASGGIDGRHPGGFARAGYRFQNEAGRIGQFDPDEITGLVQLK